MSDERIKTWSINDEDHNVIYKCYGTTYELALTQLYASDVNKGWDVVLVPDKLPEYCALVAYDPSCESSDQAIVVCVIPGNRQRHHGVYMSWWQATHPSYLLWWENLNEQEVKALRQKGMIK